MSRERELLQRVLDGDANRHWTISSRLYKKIEEVLAQPEQEPVAWMNDSGGCFLSDGNKYSENWTALYTAPPKREPLTPQKISEGNQSTLNVTREAFKQGVIFAEKAHGITGGGE
jgi:hypothetical protein